MKMNYEKPSLCVLDVTTQDILLASSKTPVRGGLDAADDYAGAAAWDEPYFRG